MIGFLIALLGLIGVTLIFQLVSNLKVVGANELAVVAGKGKAGFSTLRGGRVFVWPLVHRFFKMDLRPRTTSVRVESAIAAGIVPLTVVATVSFTLASSQRGLANAIRRILLMAEHDDELTNIATSIMEGHLRDSIAAMTPEQVMTDKDVLVQRMIKVCKADLEGIGLEITAMNIADVEDHRLEGVPAEQQLYIALLKRVQGANAETQSREAQALARATATEAREARRAEVTIRGIENEREQLLAQTRLAVAKEKQRATVGMQQAARDAEAKTAGIKSQTEAEKERIEMLRAQFNAEMLVPAQAEQERLILEARATATEYTGQAQAEIEQLRQTVEILSAGGQAALQAYLIENFDRFITPFARTLDLIPVAETSVITGASGNHAPMSAVHPHPLELEKARRLQDAFGAAGLASNDATGAPVARADTGDAVSASMLETEAAAPTPVVAREVAVETRPAPQAATAVDADEALSDVSNNDQPQTNQLQATLQSYLQRRESEEQRRAQVGKPMTMHLDSIEFDER